MPAINDREWDRNVEIARANLAEARVRAEHRINLRGLEQWVLGHEGNRIRHVNVPPMQDVGIHEDRRIEGEELPPPIPVIPPHDPYQHMSTIQRLRHIENGFYNRGEKVPDLLTKIIDELIEADNAYWNGYNTCFKERQDEEGVAE